MPNATTWISRDFPLGCRDCGQNAKRHVGRGLCGACYKKRVRRGISMDDDLTLHNDEPTLHNDDVPSFLDDERADDVAALGFDPVERVPGSTNPPVGDTPLSPPIVEKKKLFQRRPKKPKREPLPKTNERTPGGGDKRRLSTAESVEDVWTALGGMLERAGKHAPLGRYLQWQSAGAGEVVDGAVKDTYVDRKILQPALRARGSLDAIAAVAGPPLIILAIEHSPEKFTFDVDGGVNHPLLPVLASSIRSSLPTLLPAMKKAQTRKKKVDDAIREMFPDLAEGEDVVASVLSEMFAGWFNGVTPTIDEDADGLHPVS